MSALGKSTSFLVHQCGLSGLAADKVNFPGLMAVQRVCLLAGIQVDMTAEYPAVLYNMFDAYWGTSTW